MHVDALWCVASQELRPAVQAAAVRFDLKWRGWSGWGSDPRTARVCAEFGFRRAPTLALFSNGRIEDQIFGGDGGRREGRSPTDPSCAGSDAEDRIIQLVERFTH